MKMPGLLAGLALAFGLVATAQASSTSASPWTPQPVAGATTPDADTTSTLGDMVSRPPQACPNTQTSGCKNAQTQGKTTPPSLPIVPTLRSASPHAQHSHDAAARSSSSGAADGSQTAPGAGVQELGWRSLLPGSIQ